MAEKPPRAVGDQHMVPITQCPECEHDKANYEVVATVYSDDRYAGAKLSPAWTAYENAYTFCANTDCEHVGELSEFMVPRDGTHELRERIEEFARGCTEKESIDSGDAWTLIHDCYRALNGGKDLNDLFWR